MGLRDRKKASTRSALAQATNHLAMGHGFDGFTIDRVAEVAGVSRRTFFRYFDTKEAAFFAEYDARFEGFVQALRVREPRETAYRAVRRRLLDLAAYYDANREELTARHDIIRASRTLQAYDLGLDRRFEAAIIEALRPEMDDLRASVLGSALFGVVRAVLRPWFEEPSDTSLVDLGRRALALLDAGFEAEGDFVVAVAP